MGKFAGCSTVALAFLESIADATTLWYIMEFVMLPSCTAILFRTPTGVCISLLIMRISAGSSAIALAFLERVADSTGLSLLLPLLLIFLLLLLVLAHMVNPYDPPKNFSSIQIVDSENRAPLVLVREEREALGFSGALVAHEVHVDHLTVLREDGEEVALGEVEGDAADEDVGGVLELCVPRRVLADAKERLLLVDNLRPLDLRQGIHRRRLRRAAAAGYSISIAMNIRD